MPKVLFFVANHFNCLVDFQVHVFITLKQAIDLPFLLGSLISQVVADFELLIQLVA